MELLNALTLGQGKDLIILHGYFGMADNWKTLGVKFSQQGYRVHLLDQRNHGRSFHSDEFTYEAMREDLIHYMDANTIASCHLLGHSMGGKTAMYAASTYPERIDKLIVADIAPKPYPPHHQLITKALKEVDQLVLENRKQAEDELSKYISEFGVKQFLLKNLYRDESKKLRFRCNIPVLTTKMEEVGRALPIVNRFENPTLFLRGGHSQYILDEDLLGIRNQFPQSELKTIPNTGHWLHAEAPEQFLNLCLDFLALN